MGLIKLAFRLEKFGAGDNAELAPYNQRKGVVLDRIPRRMYCFDCQHFYVDALPDPCRLHNVGRMCAFEDCNKQIDWKSAQRACNDVHAILAARRANKIAVKIDEQRLGGDWLVRERTRLQLPRRSVGDLIGRHASSVYAIELNDYLLYPNWIARLHQQLKFNVPEALLTPSYLSYAQLAAHARLRLWNLHNILHIAPEEIEARVQRQEWVPNYVLLYIKTASPMLILPEPAKERKMPAENYPKVELALKIHLDDKRPWSVIRIVEGPDKLEAAMEWNTNFSSAYQTQLNMLMMGLITEAELRFSRRAQPADAGRNNVPSEAAQNRP